MRKTSFKAQMSLVMVLVVALAFILYAVSINWTRVSATKTQVTMVANRGAAGLVSQMASYGQSLMGQHMQNKPRWCDSTRAMVALITGVILLAAVILLSAIPGGQFGAALVNAIGWQGVLALVVGGLGSIGGAISYGNAEPALTNAWNQYHQNLPTQSDRLLEPGLQEMLMSAAADPVMVDDRWDLNADGRWYNPSLPVYKGVEGAEVSRVAYYYTDRMRSIPHYEHSAIDALIKALEEIKKGLGLTSADRYKSLQDFAEHQTPQTPFTDGCYRDLYNKFGLKPACNPCCEKGYAPSCLAPSETLPPAECKGAPGCSEDNLSACWVYSADNITWGVTATDAKTMAGQRTPKLMPMLGLDDGNRHNYYDQDIYIPDPYRPVYRGSDSEGYFFPFLWLLKDARPDMTTLVADPVALEKDGACHWCDDSLFSTATNCVLEQAGEVLFRPEISDPTHSDYAQLDLDKYICKENSCCTNRLRSENANLAAVDADRWIDVVGDIQEFRPLDEQACSKDLLSETKLVPWWKPGSDLFSTVLTMSEPDGADVDGNPVWGPTFDYPESMIQNPDTCPDVCVPLEACRVNNQSPMPCECTDTGFPEANRKFWRDDYMDDIIAEVHKFDQTITQLILSGLSEIGQRNLALNVNNWGFRLTQEVRILDILGGTTEEYKGKSLLLKLIAVMDQWLQNKEAIQVNGTLVGKYARNDAWCVPQDESAVVNKGEKDAITADKAPWGSLQSVVQCLDYYAGEKPREAFQACLDACSSSSLGSSSPASCKDLPRSLAESFPTTISCTNLEHKAKLKESIALLTVEQPKFKKRYDVLHDLYERGGIIQRSLKDGYAFLNTPLASCGYAPAECVRIMTKKAAEASNQEVAADPASSPLGNAIIYGWYGPKPPKGSARTRGYQHLVKVEASIPGRKADGLPSCPNNIPWIETFTKNISNVTRCYVLSAGNGAVGARVVRWDQDHAPGSGFLKFIGGAPLWRVVSGHPGNPDNFEAEETELEDKCFAEHWVRMPDQSYKQLGVDWATDEKLKEAFMISLPLGSGAPPYLKDCVATVEKFLKRGVASQSCAKYSVDQDAVKWLFNRNDWGQDDFTKKHQVITYDMRFCKCGECCK